MEDDNVPWQFSKDKIISEQSKKIAVLKGKLEELENTNKKLRKKMEYFNLIKKSFKGRLEFLFDGET